MPEFVTIPADYICIPRAEYDELHARLNGLKEDFHDQLRDQAQLIQRLNHLIEEKNDQIADRQDDLDDVKKELKETAYKLFWANEKILSLQQENAMLNDELCGNDLKEEVSDAETQGTSEAF